jgi:hypothetical protein
MADWKDLADLIFPTIDQTIADLELKFPKRDQRSSAGQGNEICSRFAPSPT